MEERKNPLKKVKVVVRPSSPALKIVVIVLILFSMAALLALRWVHTGILEETQNLKDKAAELEHENAELLEKTEQIGSVQSIQDIAQEELGLVDPDAIIIDPE